MSDDSEQNSKQNPLDKQISKDSSPSSPSSPSSSAAAAPPPPPPAPASAPEEKKQSPSSSESKTATAQQPKIDGPYSMSQINSNMTTKEAYFELLRTWIHQANMSQSAMACFPYYLMANYPQLFQQHQQQSQQQQSGSTTNGTATVAGLSRRNVFGQNPGGFGGFAGIGTGVGGVNIGNMAGLRGNERRFGDYFDNDMRQVQEELINQNGGYEFVIAPFWKRFLAEMIDSVILLLLKLILTFIIADLFDLNFGIAFNFDNLKKSIEDDYAEFLSFSSDLLLIEILTKIFVCFYEALWTTSGHIYVGGATPGKIFMGIRIVYAEAVVPLSPQQQQQGLNFLNNHNNNNNNNNNNDNNNLNILNNNGSGQLKALLFPASNPGFKRALLRAIAKNVLMALLFPMCFIILFFKNNRTAYDVMTKTIVVEENPAPILRRRVQ